MAREYGGRTKRQWLDEQRAALKQDRAQFESMWRMVYEAILPFRPRFCLTENNAPRLSTTIVNGTATLAVRRLRAKIQGELMSPWAEWYELTTGDPLLDEDKEVAVWLDEEEKAQQADLDRSNAYTEGDLAMADAIVGGTGALLVEESIGTTIHCTALPPGTYCIGLDKDGKVNRIERDFQLTTSQMVEKFAPDGDVADLPLDVRNAYREKRMLTRFDVAHMIYPNEEWDPTKPEKALQFSECYWAISASESERKQGILREGGYNEFPVMVPRWEVGAGDVYATSSPGIDALGDILELQALAQDRLRLVAMLRKPPLVVPAGMRSTGAELMPSGLTEEGEQNKGQTRPLVQVNPQALTALLEAIQDKEAKIREHFFADLAAPNLDNQREQPDTAAAVYAKNDESAILFGNVITRWDDDFSDPFIARLFGIRWRAGLVKRPPDKLQGRRLLVRLKSRLAKAQLSVGLASEERLEAGVLNTAAIVPQVLDVLDWDERVRIKARLLGADPKGINSPEETAAIRQMRAQAQAVAAQQQQAAMAAQTAKNLSQAKLGQNSALDKVAQGA